MQNAIKEITMIRTFAALAAVLTVGAVQAADMIWICPAMNIT